jgi:hypothetical protein
MGQGAAGLHGTQDRTSRDPSSGLAIHSAPVLTKEPKVEFVDDGRGKLVGINRFIGRRPILAFGNSYGDQQMLEWTAAGDGLRFVGLVHHTDAKREWAYGPRFARRQAG